MSMAQLNNVQIDTYQIINTAAQVLAPAIPVYDHAPTNPPDEYIRIDAFGNNGDTLKNCDRSRHTFMVHVFTTPRTGPSSTKGKKRAKLAMIELDAALKAGAVAGQKVRHLAYEEQPDADGASVHVFSRYSVFI